MRLQDLIDDLAEPRWKHHTITTVARRIAALYKTCPDCGGAGYWVDLGPDGKVGGVCDRCLGAGVEPTERAGAYMDDDLNWFDPDGLARYLFGED